MIIIVFLISLFILFSFLRRHLGLSLLASIAGISMYNLFSKELINLSLRHVSFLSAPHLDIIFFSLFVFLLPLLIFSYLPKAHSSSLFLKLQSLFFASFLTFLFIPKLTLFFPLDQISSDILHSTTPFHHQIILAGFLLAYLDIFFMQKSE